MVDEGRSFPRETMTDATDEDLMMRVGTGDRIAYGELVRRHLDRTIGFAQRVTGSRGDAEEVAQEAFLRVWTKAPNWRAADGGSAPARFTTWLYRVVVNLCIDRKRRPVHDPLGDSIDP